MLFTELASDDIRSKNIINTNFDAMRTLNRAWGKNPRKKHRSGVSFSAVTAAQQGYQKEDRFRGGDMLRIEA